MADSNHFEGSKCEWEANKGGSPHVHDLEHVKKFGGHVSGIMDTILDHVGYTPLVRLNRIPQSAGLECEVLAKCEFFNAGGSIKDRIGKRMVLDAEKSGRIKKGDVIIEPTSGNTGIGLALACAIKGYKMVVTMPEKMSNEKVNVLRALGADIVRTPTEAAFDSPESHIGVALKLNKETPNSHILDQYANPSNPLAHYDGTAEELLVQCGGKIDMIVAGAGTGGTIAGIGKKIKEKLPNCKIIGVDPIGSILAQPESLNVPGPSYAVEGIGYDFIPKVLDRSVVDHWYKSEDRPSLLMSRRLIAEEGLLCGGSCGTAMYCALKAAKEHGMKKGDRVVVILPDSVRNYMTKFLSDDWMIDQGFADEKINAAHQVSEWWGSRTVGALGLSTPVTVTPDLSCQSAVDIMTKQGFDQLPVVDSDSQVVGVVTEGNLASRIAASRVKPTDPVSEVLYKKFASVSTTSTLSDLNQIFNTHHFALVLSQQKSYSSADAVVEKTLVQGVVTRIDLLNYIVKSAPQK